MKRREFFLAACGSWFFANSCPAVGTSGLPAKQKVDVLIVGGGIAGFSAAYEAGLRFGSNVVILEKGPMIGGRSVFAAGSFNAVDPERQKKFGIEDSVELMTEQVWEWGGKRANKKLVRVMAENSTDAVTWLENLGIRWLDRIFVPFGGAFPRAHTSNLIRGGYEYFSAINRAVRKLNVKVLLNTEATELLVNSKGEIRGVSANRKGRKILFETRAVVLATGGFSANPEMVRRYSRLPVPSVHTTANPDGKHFDGATGDGIRMGMAVGADVVDMDCIEFMPIRGGRLLDYVGGDIFVNAEGRRFVNEGGTRSELTTAVARQPGQFMWAITDDRSDKGDTLENKLISGEVQQAATVEEMASKMRVSPSVLKQTLDRYNEFARQGKDPDFGKTPFTQTINHPPYFFGKDRLDVHYTAGGLRINERAEVLNTNGQRIAGLWAAGETTGGIHGEDRMSGNGMLDDIVFGRIAGKNAAAFAAGS